MTGALKSIAAPALLCLFAAGCGLKGPLYLPDEQPETVPAESGARTPGKRPATPQPAPQSQKEDAEQKEDPAQKEDTQSEEEPPVALPDPARPASPEPVAPPER